MKKTIFIFLLNLIFCSAILKAQEYPIEGNWIIMPEKSTHIDLFGDLSINIRINKKEIRISRVWGKGSRIYYDSIVLKINARKQTEVIESRVFPSNVFMGMKIPEGEKKNYRLKWKPGELQIKIIETYPGLISQGDGSFSAEHVFELDPVSNILTYEIRRSSRSGDQAIRYVFKRDGWRNSWFMKLKPDWDITGGLPVQAALISLQGIVNQDNPNLYFIYPKSWDFRFTPDVFEFLKDKHYYSFRELKNIDDAIKTFRQSINGYIIWDPQVRTSLIVSFTLAGLENSIVIDESLIPLMEKYNIPQIEDFRNKFRGWSDAEIYSWARDQYWDLCSRDYIVWMGGEAGSKMRPGVADWGIYKKAFFNDLSTKPDDIDEYRLADELLGEMNDMGMVFGWHSYAKDKERDHVTLTSKHGLRVEGLHTLPNMSFSSQVEITPGFKFVNNHSIDPGKKYTPEKKVYIACVQTDCLGLGAWSQSGRGSIPYAWEVTMNWVWLAPSMMEYFYSQATPNDYFIGALSGPGYMYPKAIPEEKIDQILQEARNLMNVLDLNVFEVMDYSEGATIEGNTELTEKVVSAYMKNMPDILGFINGYAPAFTFTEERDKPFISYDYYLSADRPVAEAVADIQELAYWNGKRPYYLLMHVRQWSDISHVKSILDLLGPEFEIIPLDKFMMYIKKENTFTERFLTR